MIIKVKRINDVVGDSFFKVDHTSLFDECYHIKFRGGKKGIIIPMRNIDIITEELDEEDHAESVW